MRKPWLEVLLPDPVCPAQLVLGKSGTRPGNIWHPATSSCDAVMIDSAGRSSSWGHLSIDLSGLQPRQHSPHGATGRSSRLPRHRERQRQRDTDQTDQNSVSGVVRSFQWSVISDSSDAGSCPTWLEQDHGRRPKSVPWEMACLTDVGALAISMFGASHILSRIFGHKCRPMSGTEPASSVQGTRHHWVGRSCVGRRFYLQCLTVLISAWYSPE